MTYTQPAFRSIIHDMTVQLTQPGTALSLCLLAVCAVSLLGCDGEEDRMTEESAGTGGSDDSAGTGGSDDSAEPIEHEDLTGTGTECDPAEACRQASTGCTECPDTKVCVVNILNGFSVSFGAGGEANQSAVTALAHRCVDRNNDCEPGDCSCGQEAYCSPASGCLESLTEEYIGAGNLVEVSAGATYCEEEDG